MTEDEAQQIANIAVTTDGGCPNCAAELLEALRVTFPQHTLVWEKTYQREFQMPLGGRA